MTLAVARRRLVALNSEIVALSVLTALYSGTDDIVWRTLPFELTALGIPIALLGLLQSVNIAADLVTELPAGVYVDRRGRKAAIVGGLSALGMAVGLLAISGTLELLVVSVFLIGVTEAIFLRGSSIRFFEAAAPAAQGRSIAWSAIASAVGSFVALLLAGAFLGIGLGLVYVAIAVAALLAALGSVPFLRDISVKHPGTTRAPASDGHIHVFRQVRDDFAQLRDRRFLAFSVLMQMFLSLSFGASYVFIPALGVVIGLSAADVILLFAAMRLASAVLSYAGGWLSDRYRKEWFFIGRPVSAFVLAAILATAVSPAIFIVGVMAITGISFTSPGSSAYFMSRFEETERGKAGGVNNFFTSAVGVVAPLVGGLLWTSSPTLVYGFAAIASIPGILFGVIATRIPRRVLNA